MSHRHGGKSSVRRVKTGHDARASTGHILTHRTVQAVSRRRAQTAVLRGGCDVCWFQEWQGGEQLLPEHERKPVSTPVVALRLAWQSSGAAVIYSLLLSTVMKGPGPEHASQASASFRLRGEPVEMQPKGPRLEVSRLCSDFYAKWGCCRFSRCSGCWIGRV